MAKAAGGKKKTDGTTGSTGSTGSAGPADAAGAGQSAGVDAFTHGGDRRLNLPTPELARVAREGSLRPILASYQRRDADLDPQLIWRGKYDGQAMRGGDLMVTAAPIYIQEKVHPKYLIDDLIAETAARRRAGAAGKDAGQQARPGHASLFSDFNGMAEGADRTEFYRHEQNWANRLILGDSLQVMAGLLEREGYAGKVQCVYFDPPYGIRFNSNFQWSVTSRDVKDGRADHVTREAEVVKAFRDTWRDGVHSYLGYIRDRLALARLLLAESGSVFVQIGDENVHRVRAVMDEVFGEENFVSMITFRKKLMPLGGKTLEQMSDFIVWYAKNKDSIKYHQLYRSTIPEQKGRWTGVRDNGILRRLSEDERRYLIKTSNEKDLFSTVSQWAPSFSDNSVYEFEFDGKKYYPKPGQCWITSHEKMKILAKQGRLFVEGDFPRYVVYHNDFPYAKITSPWDDTAPAQEKIYVVQTNPDVIQRCILMATDPGDLVLDPTCGSGTTAFVAEQWGRRWITADTSRVALALARARLMGARYPYYLLSDSPEGRARLGLPPGPCGLNLKEGFVYERVPHVTLKSIANNPDIDAIWEKWQQKIGPALAGLNGALKAAKTPWDEWQVPASADAAWPADAKKLHAAFIDARLSRQKEIDASIAARAETETLFDRPHVDAKRVRVAGPFTVESTSPTRQATVGEDGHVAEPRGAAEGLDFGPMIIEELRAAGVQGVTKDDRIRFDSLTPWPGRYVAAEGLYRRGDRDKSDGQGDQGGPGGDGGRIRRAAIFIGSEFATVQRTDLVAAAAEAAEGGFTDLLACAFSYGADCADLANVGRIPVLKARMNSELHMSRDLKSDGKGNLFVIFGEPDVAIENAGEGQIRVRIRGVDVYDTVSGEVRSDDLDGIACWLIDTNYNEECFFVRHAYFLGADPHFDGLRRSLKAEIDRDAWESLRGDVSRPFPKPGTGRIAVKVINQFGDEVMKVYRA